MHAGTEQLLSLRDGDPLDAGIAQHVTDCAQCRNRLAEIDGLRAQLRQMPELIPPTGVWQAIEKRLDAPVRSQHGWLGAAIAAGVALIALAIWQTGGRDTGSTNQLVDGGVRAGDIETPGPIAEQAETNGLELAALVSQSRRLEQVLRELNTSSPRVMDAGIAGTIADLQDGIAYIDYGLSYDERLNQTQSEQLWRQRVGLMNTLVQVRGAQLQQIAN